MYIDTLHIRKSSPVAGMNLVGSYSLISIINWINLEENLINSSISWDNRKMNWNSILYKAGQGYKFPQPHLSFHLNLIQLDNKISKANYAFNFWMRSFISEWHFRT